jgi:spore coat protein U-like protein
MQAAVGHTYYRSVPNWSNPSSLTRPRPLFLPLFMPLLLLLLLPSSSLAQTIYTSGVVNGSLRVLNVLTISTEQNLDFGRIVQNSTREITANDPLAGRLLITKSANQGITIQVDYPPSLISGPNSLNLTSNSNSGKYVAGGSSTEVSFNPSGYTSPAGILPSANSLYVYLGGILAPTLATVPGVYTGQITVSVTYSGI